MSSTHTASSTDSSPFQLTPGVGQRLLNVSDASRTTSAAASAIQRHRPLRFDTPAMSSYDRVSCAWAHHPRRASRLWYELSSVEFVTNETPGVPPQPNDVNEERVAKRRKRHGSYHATDRGLDQRHDDDAQTDHLDDADRLTPTTRRQRTLKPGPHVAGRDEQVSQHPAQEDPRPGLAVLPHEDRQREHQQRVGFHVEASPEIARHTATAREPSVRGVEHRHHESRGGGACGHHRQLWFADETHHQGDEHDSSGRRLVRWTEARERMMLAKEADCNQHDPHEDATGLQGVQLAQVQAGTYHRREHHDRDKTEHLGGDNARAQRSVRKLPAKTDHLSSDAVEL